MVRVEPTRIVAARRRSGLTRAALAKELGVSSALVGQWEDDVRDATGRIDEIALALGMPQSFFEREELTITEPASVSFRRRQDAKRATRDRAASAVDLAYGDVLPMLKEIAGPLPFPTLPDLRGMAPETAAVLLRETWGLGDAPIKSVVSLLEAKGVRVFMTADPSPSLSAFTRWIEGEPLLFLNTSIADGCRHRFNAAHELGHLVLHRDLDFEQADARAVEREADAFASAFLLTRRFLDEAPPTFRPNDYFALKPRWGVSAQAMVRRMRDSGRFTDWQYENAFIWLSKNGYRSNPEPNAGTMESSVLHERFVERLAERDLDPVRYAERANFPPNILFELMPATRHAMGTLQLRSLFAEGEEPLGLFSSRNESLAFYED